MAYEILSMLEQLAPDLMKKITLRAMVLERISVLQPVGRRALAQRLHMPEREIRSVCDALKEDGLISVGTSGMIPTERAEGLLPGARIMTGRRSALGQLEQHLSRVLNVSRVCVVPGDADEIVSAQSKKMSSNASSKPASDPFAEIGRAAAEQLLRFLAPEAVLTVSGGKLMAAVAAAMPSAASSNAKVNIRVLPAHGLIGTDVETQADTLAARFAQALGGSYSLLHLPDAAPPEALRELIRLPQVSEVLHLLQQTDVLLYQVNRAEDAVRERSLPAEEAKRLLHAGVSAEAIGCYFDPAGRMLLSSCGVGLNADQLSKIQCIAVVAAGASRARALLSVVRHHRHELVVLDEGAARALEKLI